MTKRSQGMLLLELLVALAIFMMVVPLFGSVWTTHKRAVMQGRATLGASNIGQLVLNEAISVGYSGVDAMAARPLVDRTISLKETVVDGRITPSPPPRISATDFVWNLAVTHPGPSGEKMVTVTIRWEQLGQPKELALSTLLVENT